MVSEEEKIIWIRISTPRATFMVVEKNGIIIDAAPISRWAIGKSTETCIDWWKKKGADQVDFLT